MSVTTASPPLVSVIMAAYNMEQVISEAIESIIDQTYPYWELLVIDDGSTDQTAQVVREFRDPRVRYFGQPNGGRSRARNHGLRHSRGRYLALMDADDISPHDRLARQVEFLESNRDVGIVSGRVLSFAEGTPLQQLQSYPATSPGIHQRFSRGVMGVCHGGAMLRSEVIQRIGMYCEDCLLAEDLDLFLRAAESFKFAAIPAVVLHYRNEPRQTCFRRWTRLHLYHEYAVYRRDCLRAGDQPRCFAQFVRTLRPWLRVLTWHSLRYVKLKAMIPRSSGMPETPAAALAAGGGPGRMVQGR